MGLNREALAQIPNPSSVVAVGNHRPPKTLFSDLAVELHEIVFNYLDIKDVVNLGLTNNYFWSVGLKHIQTFQMSFLGSWAGQNIICVGDCNEAGDYPPGLFTDDEKLELSKIKGEDNTDLELYHIAAHYEPTRTGPDLRPLCDKYAYYMNCPNYYYTQYSKVRHALKWKPSRYYPGNQPWILRNLTTKEIVRSEAVALNPKHIHGPLIDNFGFGEVVLSRISWPPSDDVPMCYTGVWAGHSFDIIPLARHIQDTKDEEWQDSSEEVVEEIAAIWENEYGPDWREILNG